MTKQDKANWKRWNKWVEDMTKDYAKAYNREQIKGWDEINKVRLLHRYSLDSNKSEVHNMEFTMLLHSLAKAKGLIK